LRERLGKALPTRYACNDGRTPSLTPREEEPMQRLFAVVPVVALALVCGPVAADDKDKPALSGTWTREANGLDLKFVFEKETFKVSAFAGDNGVTVTCKYTVEKDGTVKAKITKVEEKGMFQAKPPEGLEFSFKWKAKGDTANLDDLKGQNLEEAKSVLEGDYQKKKAD
jgi:hypothetical protein